MIDYLLGPFTDEAAAIAALPSFYNTTNNTWDMSCIMASSKCGTPFFCFMGIDQLDGYWVSISTATVDETLWSLSAALVEGDRDSATILRTRFDAEQLQAFNVSPVFAGMSYLYPGQGKNFVLDVSQHPVGDSDGGILESS